MTDPLMLLSRDHGEGRLTFRALKAGGFEDVPAIAEASVRDIADRGHFSMQTAQRLKTGAREMLRKGIGARNARAQTRGARSDPSSGRATRRFSDGITRQEALNLQREEPRPADLAPGEEPEPSEPPPVEERENDRRDGTFWSFG